MTKVVVFLLVAALFQTAGAGERDDKWLAQDKLLHISLSTVLASTLYHMHQYKYGDSKVSSGIVAVQMTISLGIAKEIKDGKFSYRDLLADLIGVTIALTVFVR